MVHSRTGDDIAPDIPKMSLTGLLFLSENPKTKLSNMTKNMPMAVCTLD